MSASREETMIRAYRLAIGVFILGLVASGLTAFPLRWEIEVLARWLGIPPNVDPQSLGGLDYWVAYVRQGLRESYAAYPFLGYGTDWLAFGHLVIALFFVRPFIRVREDHDWVLICGMIACVGVFPTAIIAGAVREIPWGWRLFDCAFGVIGLLPLAIAFRLGRRIRDKRSDDRAGVAGPVTP